jgi:cytochrome oxidase assembly protein ShyY1
VSKRFGNPNRRLFFPVVIVLVALCVLCGLGFWQIERKAWKENLIAALHERLAATPAPLPAPREWNGLTQNADEFRRVTARLQFPAGRRAFVFSGTSALRPDIKSPGYFTFVPATLAGGETVVVNAGFSADRQSFDLAGTREITGYLRWPEKPSWFVSEHDAAGEVFSARDHRAMAEARGWGNVAPFYIDQEAPAPSADGPRPGPLTVRLPNNHLGYALTWFGLSLGLAAVFGAWLRGQVRKGVRSRRRSPSL